MNWIELNRFCGDIRFKVRFFYSTVSYWHIGVYKNWLNQPTFSNLVFYSYSNISPNCILLIDWLTLGKDKVSFLNSHISLQRFFFLRFSHRSETRFTFWYRCQQLAVDLHKICIDKKWHAAYGNSMTNLHTYRGKQNYMLN